MERTNKVAVVILNWNGCQMLRQFLPSVVAHSEADGGVVYVADNGSTDDSVEMLCQEFPMVRQILMDENYGFAEGYNRAIAELNEPYVVLLNSDVEVTSHWLQPLIAYMDAHPEVAACQPKLLSYNEPDKFEYAGAAGGFIDCYGYPFCRGRLMQQVELDKGQYDEPAEIFWASGAALFIRRNDYEAVGGLDPRFFAHMEEIDLCWRLKARGRGIVCLPESVVFHVGGATLKRENPNKTYLNFRNNLIMLYKNLPERELGHVMRVRFLLDHVAAFTFLLKGQWQNALAVRHARKEYHRQRPYFRASRMDNQRKAKQPRPQGKVKFSLLIQYYLLFRKRYSQLG